MTFTLLILLAVLSLVITIAGFILSHKSQAREGDRQEAVSTEEPRDKRVVRKLGREGYIKEGYRYGATRYGNAMYARTSIPAQQSIWPGLWQSLGVERIFRGRRNEPTPWMGIALILLVLFLFGILLLRTLLPNSFLVSSIFPPPAAPPTNQNPGPTLIGESQTLVRLGQLDPSQYGSTQEYDVWAYSACSSAAITEVINAYGHHYRIADILKVESGLGEITPQLGLMEDVGISRTVARFGFKTTWGYSLSLDHLIAIANNGTPVIVSFPPSRYTGGHIVVVIGGNSTSVFLADSSLFNRHVLSHKQFSQWWGGFSAVVSPN